MCMTNQNDNGTCYTQADCERKGGKPRVSLQFSTFFSRWLQMILTLYKVKKTCSYFFLNQGSCASGYGVCCYFDYMCSQSILYNLKLGIMCKWVWSLLLF